MFKLDCAPSDVSVDLKSPVLPAHARCDQGSLPAAETPTSGHLRLGDSPGLRT